MAATSGLRLSRWVYYVGALIHVMACAGTIFGWQNMQYILAKEGAFSNVCSNGGGAPSSACAEQTLQLSSVYSTASVFSFCVPALSGMFQDRFGPRMTIRLLSVVFAVGVLLLFGALQARSWSLLFPAFAAIGAAASSNLLPLYSVATLFRDNQSLAISVLSGAFDAGTITWFVFARLYDSGWSTTTILTAYLAGPVALQLLMAAFLWPEKPFDSYLQGHHEGSGEPAAVLESPSPAAAETSPEVGAAAGTSGAGGRSPTEEEPRAAGRGQRRWDGEGPDATTAIQLEVDTGVAEAAGGSAVGRAAEAEVAPLTPSKSTRLGPTHSQGSVGSQGHHHGAGGLSRTSSKPSSPVLTLARAPSLSDALHSLAAAASAVTPRSPALGYSRLGLAHEGHAAGGGAGEHEEEGEADHTVAGAEAGGTAPGELSLGPLPLRREGSSSGTSGWGPADRTANPVSRNSREEAAVPAATGSVAVQDWDRRPSAAGVAVGGTGPARRPSAAAVPDTGTTAPPAEAAPAPASVGLPRSPFMPAIDSGILSRLPAKRQLATPEYLAYLLFFVLCLVRFNFYISSVGSQLDAMGQGPDAAYAKTFGYILPCGFFMNLAIGAALDRYGPVLGMAAVWALGTAVSVLCMIPVLPLQVLTFIVFTAFRGTIFCAMTVFLSAIFGFGTLGSLVGLLTAAGGILGLSTNGLLLWALNGPGTTADRANFAPPNGLLLALMLLSGLFPLWLAKRAGHASLWAALRHGGKLPEEGSKTGAGGAGAAATGGGQSRTGISV